MPVNFISYHRSGSAALQHKGKALCLVFDIIFAEA